MLIKKEKEAIFIKRLQNKSFINIIPRNIPKSQAESGALAPFDLSI